MGYCVDAVGRWDYLKAIKEPGWGIFPEYHAEPIDPAGKLLLKCRVPRHPEKRPTGGEVIERAASALESGHPFIHI